MAEFVAVAKVGDIPAGGGAAFTVNNRVVAVFNTEDGYHAIDDMCPHAGASLADGYLEECVVACPLHAWRFDVRDGTWCDNRRLKIDAFEVRVVDDEIQVLVPDPDPLPEVPTDDEKP